jgi:hypothetical protein
MLVDGSGRQAETIADPGGGQTEGRQVQTFTLAIRKAVAG